MGELKEPDIDISQRKFASFLKMAGGLLNSESMDIKFGQAGAYDNSEVAPNRNRAPGSRVRDKNSARKGK